MESYAVSGSIRDGRGDFLDICGGSLCQSNAVAITLTIICLISIADGRLDPPLTALSSWWSSYSSTVLKSYPSVVRSIGLVICVPTIDVIAATIASFTPISVIRVVLCLSALY